MPNLSDKWETVYKGKTAWCWSDGRRKCIHPDKVMRCIVGSFKNCKILKRRGK